MSNKRLVFVLLSIFMVVVIAGCSSATPTPEPEPTPTATSKISLEEAGALMRAVTLKEPGCGSLDLIGATFKPTWEPSTRSWLVHITAPGGLEGDYRIFEERAFAIDPVKQLVPGKC